MARKTPRRRVDPLGQLAASVLARETTEIPWGLLRQTYFTAKWDRSAVRQLGEWAERYGIRVSIEQPHPTPGTRIRFSVPA